MQAPSTARRLAASAALLAVPLLATAPIASAASGQTQQKTPATAAWLPSGCRLMEVGPASVGYKRAAACYVKGIAVPNGYMLVRGSASPAVHSKSGASG